jgi:protein ImuB
MTRVASLYLPQLPIERLRRLERPARPPERDPARPAPLPILPAIDDEPGACSVPRGGGWRPGARWARDAAPSVRPSQAAVDALPAHQRPTMREMGPRSEHADHPFKGELIGGQPVSGQSVEAHPFRAHPFKLMPADDGAPGHASPHRDIALPLWGRPLVLIERSGQRDVVTAACLVAAELGLRPGMAAAQARALVADLEVRDAQPGSDAALLDRLVLHAIAHWTPTASIAGADGLWLDLTGTAHLFGGEERFCARLIRFLRRLGFTAAVAIAGTPGAAHALARWSGRAVVVLPTGHETQAIADLPLAALRLAPEALDAAARFGLERIGDLYGMPRGPLARRLGLASLRRLDEARGGVAEPIVGVVPFDQPVARRRLLEPILTAEAIGQVIGDLVDDLVTVLQTRHLGVRALILTCRLIDSGEQQVGLGTAKATRDARHLKRMLAMRIERIDPGMGIEEMGLAAPQVEDLQPEALSGGLADGRSADLAPLVDQLAGRAGEAALFRMSALESDVPERAAHRIGPLAQPVSWPDWTRPARLLRKPELLSGVVALLPDHPPRRFAWRRKVYQVARGDGPERIHGEWWRSTREMWAVRDYFRVEATSGERFWLFRRGDGIAPKTGDLSWYMHGLFG